MGGLLTFAERIVDRIRSENLPASLELPGNRPYREYHGVPLKPKADKTCNQCGVCADRCPVGAIAKTNPRETDREKCISCMRCVKICPRQARKVNSLLVFAASRKMKKTCQARKKNELFL